MTISIAFVAAMLAASPAQSAAPARAVATAPEPSRAPSAKAVALVNLMHFDEQLDHTYAQVAPLVGAQMVAGLEKSPLTSGYLATLLAKLPGGQARLAKIGAEEFQQEVRKIYPDLKAAMAGAFDADFTASEIDDLTRFFSTGTGAKYLASQTIMQTQLQKAAQSVGERVAGLAQTAALHRAESEAGIAPASAPH
jgi:hypothetical protein